MSLNKSIAKYRHVAFNYMGVDICEGVRHTVVLKCLYFLTLILLHICGLSVIKNQQLQLNTARTIFSILVTVHLYCDAGDVSLVDQ